MCISVAILSTAASLMGMPNLLAQSAQSTQRLPWQIGGTALAGKQTNPLIFLAPDQVSIAAGKPATIDLHFRVADGMHINSHSPHDGSLVPTQILVAENNALDTTAVDFPAGNDETLAFAPKQKLNVYTGEFVLHAHLTAKPGTHMWQGVVRYQACDNRECLPPKKAAVEVQIIAR